MKKPSAQNDATGPSGTDHAAIANTLAGRLIIEELVRVGVAEVIVAPGSRSTPLAAAAARHPRVQVRVVVDERAAAFFALGVGRATGRPAALITTSGSAAGHALPAVIEADAARVPLLILSADRPPELRATGANQTIDQVHLFGGRVRWFADVPCPDGGFGADLARPLLTTIDHAVAAAQDGPVHLNLQFRKPLDPVGAEQVQGSAVEAAARLDLGLAALVEAAQPHHVDPMLRRWLESSHPYTRWLPAAHTPGQSAMASLRPVLAGATVGVLVVGALDDPSERAAARVLATRLGWPVVADIASGLRLGPPLPNLLPHHDVMLASDTWAEALRPDVVLRVGGPLVSQPVQRWLDSAAPEHHVVVRPDRVRFDPGHGVTLRLQAHLSGLCAAFGEDWPQPSATLRAQLRTWRFVAQEVAAGLGALSGEEIAVAQGVRAVLPAGTGLWAASSMTVRLLDAFAPEAGAPVVVTAARGASGIDGLIAQAAGWTVARGRPGVLLVGDLAALHDVSALQVLAAERIDLVIVVVNNGGGGIFSLLPIRERSPDFEPVFAAAHELRVAPWAAAAGVPAATVPDAAALPAALAAALAAGGPHLLELHTDREAARLAWRAARTTVAEWTSHHMAAHA